MSNIETEMGITTFAGDTQTKFLIIFVLSMLQNNLRKTKSLNTNNQKCKKKQVQTNTDTLDPYDLFSRGLRRSKK